MIIKDIKKRVNGISVFSCDVEEDYRDYNAKGIDCLYLQEERNFWFIARKEFIYQIFSKIANKNESIIEIGAGTGNVSRYLMGNGYKNISVGEIHFSGLRYAQTYGIRSCYQMDILDTPFSEEFDNVCMFDVLEHIQDDDLVLKNVHQTLNQNGKLILTVPAHMWLWNRHDALASHKIRYIKSQLIAKLECNGFTVVEARYFFIFITPLLLLRRILQKDDRSEANTEGVENADISINPLINKILLFLSRLENKINNYLPNLFGGSLLVVAQKR